MEESGTPLNSVSEEESLKAVEYQGKVLAYELEHRSFIEENDSEDDKRPIEGE